MGGVLFSSEIDPRAINMVVYYRQGEAELFSQFLSLCKSRARTRCIPYELSDATVPINKFKNLGIDKVVTTHFIFAENNLSPTSRFLSPSSLQANLYGDLLKTPGYLWRDPFFVGVVPVFEWASDAYTDARAAFQFSCVFFFT